MRIPRPLLALGASLAIHAAAATALVGAAVWEGWKLGQKIDLELVSMKTEAPKELPLGPPPSPRAAGDERNAPGRRRAKTRGADDGVKIAVADAGAGDGGSPADARGADAEAGAGGDAGRGRPKDLRAYGPAGSRVTALLRLDRLRAGPEAPLLQAATSELLMRLPDWSRLFEGSGLDLHRDLDALLIATPNPLDPDVTFIAARHHLADPALQAALDRGARAAGRPIRWRRESDRPVGLRVRRPPTPGEPAPPFERDDRLFVLPQPGLAVIAPPAYAALLLPVAGDGGAPRGGDGGPPGGAEHWRALVARIDAEDGAMPDDAVLMLTLANLFVARGGDSTRLPTGPLGLPLPPVATAIVSTAPTPSLELVCEYERLADAEAAEQIWPGIKRQLVGNPMVLLAGLTPILARAELRREEATVVLRTTATVPETRRLLGMITTLLGAGQR